MSEVPITRPDPSEFAPHAKAYVDLVPEGDFLGHLAQQVETTGALLQPVDEDRASTFTYAPGKWTIKQTIGHLSDTERILACRALRMARADTTPQPGFEQDDYVQSAHASRRTMASLLDEFRSVRQATLSLFKSFSPEDWTRQGPVSNWHLTVRGIAFTLAGHELHHLRILNKLYLD